MMPLYAIMLLVIIIIFLWGFFGGGDYEFIGLNPLQPENIITAKDAESASDSFLCFNTSSSTNTNNTASVTNNTEDENSVHHCSISSRSGASNVISEKISVIDDINKYVDNSEESEESLDMMHDIPLVYDPTREIDLTPALPEEFTKECSKDNNKFESKGEKICRDTMEKIYGVPFINVRPSWLKNPLTNRNLELDCYNEKLKLAVEYGGEQHFKWCSFAKQSYTDFRNQVYRDRIKVELCKEHGVYLIVVPYNVPLTLIPTYIIYHLPEIVRKRLHEAHL